MKSIIYDDSIDFESVEELMEKIDGIISDDDAKVNVYFNTGGGDYNAGLVLIDYINRHKDKIKLTAVENISSTGFHIFYKTECEHEILDGLYSVMHLTTRSIETRNMRNARHLDAFFKEEMEKENADELEWFETLPLSNKDIKALETGEDIYLNTNKLRKILKHVEKRLL